MTAGLAHDMCAQTDKLLPSNWQALFSAGVLAPTGFMVLTNV